MELEVGMYVRTKKGKIYKFESNNSMAKNGAKKYMVNCSYNIKDLIEEHDYIRIITSAFFEPVYYSYGKLVIRDDIPIENYSNDFIAEVITHQKMKSESYKVNE